MMDTQRQDISDATARVLAVQDDLVTIETLEGVERSPLIKNEVVLVCPSPDDGQAGQERLKAEVLRIEGNTAVAQVFENKILCLRHVPILP